jgi:hypothetical protein
MVLVSHVYKFIYLKNVKVAGTSIESFFAQFCIAPADKATYNFPNKQNEIISEYGILGERGGKFTTWYGHKDAAAIKTDLGNKIFDKYLKFCVVRNPYDAVVSHYFFKKTNDDFKTYVKNFKNGNHPASNLPRLFLNNLPVCDFYIRYENLIEDTHKLLKLLGITDYNIEDMPTHKTNHNPHTKSYKDYYDDETKEIVRKLFEKEIDFFKYEF